ncbi:PocR ligand-binding domain-containing protein [Clostridium peptidivorans]|uniref:PocR ligand-binding domain-containing protein n=1 Tax=Clostridium peptidivorans TaxID=100174 RepID=UPI0015C99D5B|nr:PocR ligand-binding domain-containing protein [Clostridium peptidivorans]
MAKYKLEELVDMQKLQKLMDKFYNITKLPHGVLNLEGKMLINTRWQMACEKFHRKISDSRQHCIEGFIKNKEVERGEDYTLTQCRNGLMSAFIPIEIDGEIIANFIIGQFFIKEPNLEIFEIQAQKFGIDEKAYLESIKSVPIVEKERLEDIICYYKSLAKVFAEMGLSKIKEIELRKQVEVCNRQLQEELKERKAELQQNNNQLLEEQERMRQVKEALRESEEQYKRLVELLPIGVYIRDKERYLYCNQAGAKLLGVQESHQVIGNKVNDFLRFTKQQQYQFERDYDDVILSNEKPFSQCRFLRAKDKKYIYLEGIGAKCPYNGKDQMLIVSQDISDRKTKERLRTTVAEKTRQLNEAMAYEKLRTDFFANLSHELRTPLNIILTSLQVANIILEDMSKTNKSENLQKLFRYKNLIKQNSYRLIRLVNNLIDITKIDAGYFQVFPKNCNIVSLVEDIALSVTEYAKNKDINLVFDTNVEEKIMACDEDKIERIILNLLSNSLKFTPKGGEIKVNFEDQDTNILISVEDNGIGIPKDKLESIFDRFVQVDKSLSRNNEGSGIGLSLIKSLVELHRGKIWVESNWGYGSKFFIKLPVKVLSQEENENVNISSGTNKGEKINIEFSDIYFS